MDKAKNASEPSLDSTIRVNEQVVFRKLEAEGILVRLDTTEYFGLDSLGIRIWSLLEQGRSLPEVLQELLKEYECDEQRCREDLLQFVGRLADHGLVFVGEAF
ncbi:MAG: PqqD family protein [Candidatus Acidiferrales bacterium]